MDEGNVLNLVLTRTLDAIDHGFGLIQGDVHWLFGSLLVLNLVLAGLTWATSREEVSVALARRVIYIGVFIWLVTQWPTLTETVGRSFVTLGLRAGGGGIATRDFYDPGRVVAAGWSGGWVIFGAASQLTGVRATFVNLPHIVVLTAAAGVYFIAFALLAFQVFLAIVQFKVGSLASFVLLPFALLSKTSFLAERPLGWVFASGVRLMVLALVMAIGADLVTTVASVPADQLTIRQAVATALGAASLFVLARMASGMAGDLVSGSPSLGMDGGSMAIGASRLTGGTAAMGLSTAATQVDRGGRWVAMRAASTVPGLGAAAKVAGATTSGQ